MCVIMLVSKVRPSEEMVERAWHANKDGMGIAHREGGDVVWEKGVMDLNRAKELCAKTPLPYVAHFRVASIGGVKPSLTHPFVVGPEARLDLVGRTKVGVLFHNGHWNPWNEKVLDAAIHSNNKIPEGSDWSDSRAMAWLVHIYGPGLMEVLPSQKGILMTPKKLHIFTGNGWEKINEVWCSNDYFWGRTRGNYRNTYHRLCSVGRCTNNAQSGKDMCEKCETELKAKMEKDTGAGNSASSVGQPTAMTIVNGGNTRPLARLYTMAEVEVFYKNSAISKSILKKYRKANGARGQTKGSRAARALKQMQDLSAEIAERLLTGSAN